MLIEFIRTQTTIVEGEDDRIDTVEHQVAVNPEYVAAVFENLRAGAGPSVVIRLSDGRGLEVRGPYSEVVEKIRAAGGNVPNALEATGR